MITTITGTPEGHQKTISNQWIEQDTKQDKFSKKIEQDTNK